MIISHYTTNALLDEIDTWLDGYAPPREVIGTFCILLENGYEIKSNSPTAQNTKYGTVTAKKDYIKVHWSGSNKQIHVSILVDKGLNNYVRATEGPGIEKFGRLIDVDAFLADPPESRNPLFLYGEPIGIDFIPRIAVVKGTATMLDAYQTAKVLFLCRVHNSMILTDIDDPFHGPKCKWFAIEVNGYLRQGVVLFDRERWLPATKEADRVYKETRVKLTIGDKELLNTAVELFAAEVFKRGK